MNDHLHYVKSSEPPITSLGHLDSDSARSSKTKAFTKSVIADETKLSTSGVGSCDKKTTVYLSSASSTSCPGEEVIEDVTSSQQTINDAEQIEQSEAVGVEGKQQSQKGQHELYNLFIKRQKIKDAGDRVRNEWRIVALVIDRLFFYTYIAAIIAITVMFLPRSEMNDYR